MKFITNKERLDKATASEIIEDKQEKNTESILPNNPILKSTGSEINTAVACEENNLQNAYLVYNNKQYLLHTYLPILFGISFGIELFLMILVIVALCKH